MLTLSQRLFQICLVFFTQIQIQNFHVWSIAFDTETFIYAMYCFFELSKHLCYRLFLNLQFPGKEEGISFSRAQIDLSGKKPSPPIQILARGPILRFKFLGLFTLQNIERFYRKFIVSSSQYF